MLTEYMKKQNLTKSLLAQRAGIPYSTLSDILSGKADIRKCSAETIYKLAKALRVSMENLLAPYVERRYDFELFKSNECHKLKRLGDRDYIIDALKTDYIRKYYNWQWYPECLYLLAMLDYISRINDVPLCDRYDDLRGKTLSERLYPSSILALSLVFGNDDAKKRSERESIPEFLKYNIIESDIRNVV